jgi:uncharacterized NAD(P)/FAD-binding protein YdhS
MPAPVRTIVIAGAGFSGTATAVHLLRQLRQAARVVLIERGPEFGRGVAYATTEFPFILNVPASRMSASAGDPGDFLRYAVQQDPRISAGDFLPRALYGDYLESRLREAAAAAAHEVILDCRRGSVVDVYPGTSGRPVVALDDGALIPADDVVLALGNPPARTVAGVAEMADADGVAGTDSAASPRARPNRLLVLGTGLSMVDAVYAALAQRPGIEIHALSRHGLVPPSQTQFAPAAFHDHAHRLGHASGSIRRLVTVVRDLAREAERSGSDWREVITLVRHEAPSLWHGLADSERRRFLRHVRSYWDVHRHRLAPEVASRIDSLRRSGQLVIHAGRLVSVVRSPDGFDASWRVRGSGRRRDLSAFSVLNCTGPDYDLTHTTDPLWRALIGRGVALPDGLGLGVRTGPHGELSGGPGAGPNRVFYIGPMLRADHWEATAVGELRVHAERLAQHLSRPGVAE